MDAEKKKLICDALRSGRYHQGRFQLRTEGDAYCCLGVICDVSGVGRWRQFNSGRWAYSTTNRLNMIFLPNAVQQWGGIDLDLHDHLVRMNDRGDSFEEIADHIESAG